MLFFFFLNDTATTEIYPLSLHDALPIGDTPRPGSLPPGTPGPRAHHRRSVLRLRTAPAVRRRRDRKSTRLNSSHANISYAVFCLKKKKKHKTPIHTHIVLELYFFHAFHA